MLNNDCWLALTLNATLGCESSYSLVLCSSFQALRWTLLSTCFSLIHPQCTCVCGACQSPETWHTLFTGKKDISPKPLCLCHMLLDTGYLFLAFFSIAQVIQHKSRAFMNLLGQFVNLANIWSPCREDLNKIWTCKIDFYRFLLPAMHCGRGRYKITRKSTSVGSLEHEWDWVSGQVSVD